MRYAACFLILGLAACSAPDKEQAADDTVPATEQRTVAAPDGAAQEAVASGVALSLDGDGLRIVLTETGATRPIAFGTDRASVERAVSSALGSEPVRENNGECPAGPMAFSRYGAALTLNFQGDSFVGWSIDDGSDLTTMDGIGIGSRRADIADSRDPVETIDSTLGDEIMIGAGESALSALLNDQGRVAELWAGTNCIFR